MTEREREELVADIVGEFSQSFASARTRWAKSAEEIHPELSAPGMMLLQTILRRGPITSTGLGAILDMDKAMVSRQITKLRALGLVDAREAESDRRVMLLTASAEAHSAVDTMHSKISADYRERFAEWQSSELEHLRDLLHRYNTTSVPPHAETPASRCAREERNEA